MIGNRRNFPAALVVPNFANLEKWAREQGISFASRGGAGGATRGSSTSTTARCRT